MKRISNFLRETDIFLLFVCLATSAFGVLMVHSATLSSLEDGKFVSRETLVMFIAIGLGLVIALIASVVDYEMILKLWPVVAGVSLLLMLALFKWGTGPEGRNDVKTWIPLGGVYFQPSELLKVAFIITFSIHLEMVRDNLNSIKNVFLLCVHGAVPCLLVVLTGDMGSALVFVMIFVIMLFIAGLKLRYFAIAGGLIIAAAPILWIKVFNNIQRDRFLALIYPDSYPDIIYQQLQGKNAIGSGQLLGAGLFKGSYTQGGIVPESQNDMILSVVGEEFGFVGCLLLLVLFALIIFRIIKVSRMSNDTPGKFLCIGTAIMIASQIAVNVGMCLMLLPCIGITLPFMSSGGSSNLCIYIAIGLVLSVYRYNKDRAPTDFRLINVSTPFS